MCSAQSSMKKVERVDDLHVGDQPDGDRQAAGTVREHQPGQEVFRMRPAAN